MPMTRAKASPTVAFLSSIRRPLDSLARPSSFSEQSIPNDFTPRSSAGFISRPQGRCAPIFATGTISPSAMFFAPQTIVSFSKTVSRVHTVSFSALGCFSILRIFPVTTFSRPFPRYSTASTFRPPMVMSAAIFSGAMPSKFRN
ncbi:MAG: hypothetical protein ACD_47C00622G0002 [uncultured bacterium]|nr:MAG: hypothetical protein ACD_47C00622G0002 [uncultured bacterium]